MVYVTYMRYYKIFLKSRYTRVSWTYKNTFISHPVIFMEQERAYDAQNDLRQHVLNYEGLFGS